MELVLFKDLLEDDAEPQYGLLEDRDEPSVFCLCCGSRVEFRDYEIIEYLPWKDFSSAVKQAEKGKYVVCMDSYWVRDSQMVDISGLTDNQLDDIMNTKLEDRWHDMEPNPFIAIIEADSEEDACKKAAEQHRYDSRCLYAIKI